MSKKTTTYTKFYDNVKVTYEYNIINPKSNFVITGYWWGRGNINKNSKDNLTYDQLSQRLIDSCVKNNCNYFIAEIPEFAIPGGYQKAINYKPKFILHTLDIIYPRMAANIDTDMTIEKYPDLFDLPYDFIGYNWHYEPRLPYEEFPIDCFDPYVMSTSGGLMCFGNTEPSKKFLKDWDDTTDNMPGKAEDRTVAIPFNKKFYLTELRCLWLPVNYFYIPYFFEQKDFFTIPKKYQKYFPHLQFSGNQTKKEYTFAKVFKITKKNIYILHPEGLTSEEQAALQGASSDRIPQEYFIEVGKKLKCLTEFNKLVNIPEIYCETKENIKSFSQINKLLDSTGFVKLQKKIPRISNKRKFSILSEEISNNSDILFVFNDCISEDLIKNYNYIVVDLINSKKSKNFPKSYLIHKIMEKYQKNIIYLENCTNITENHLELLIQSLDSSDFSCINSNSSKTPLYKKDFAESCHDPRSLSCLTTDILFFRNNRFGKNLLKLWNSEYKIKLDDRDSLSIAFNKYMYVIYSRVKWLNPMFFVPTSQKIFRTTPKNPIFTFNSEIKSKRNVNLFDYLKQCKDKPKLTKTGGAKASHY
jgi:hypothetical protein